MTLPGTLVLLSFLAFFAFAMATQIAHGEIMEAVNKKVPPDEQWPRFQNIFAIRFSAWELFRIYRELYPDGSLIRRYLFCNFGAIGMFAACIASLYWALRR